VSKRLKKSPKARKNNIRISIYAAIVVVSIVFCAGTIFLIRSNLVRLHSVVVSGNEIVKREAIEEIISESRRDSLFWIIPKDNVVLFSRSKLKTKIQERLSTIAHTEVSFTDFYTLEVKVREHKPTYLWCASLLREKCYFMNESGFIFNEAAGFSEGVLFTYYGLVDTAAPIGKTYLPVEKFIELNKFTESLRLLKIVPVGLNVLEQDDYEIHLSSGSTILFSGREDFLQTFANLETIITEQLRSNKNFLAEVDYIDVRFVSKAFLKLK